MKITTLEQLKTLAKDWMKITCNINGTFIEWNITIERGNIFICQNRKEWNDCKDKKWYKYSWEIICDFEFNTLSNIELPEVEDVIFAPWEQVGVSDVSEEQALEDLETDDRKYYYIWKNRSWNFVVETKEGWTSEWEYICKIPKEEKAVKPY